MFSKILTLTAASAAIVFSGCASEGGKPLSTMANSGVPSISYVPAPGAPAGYGYIQCVYAYLNDATAHTTDWQRGNAANGPWAPSATTYYSFSAVPQTATSASGYRDYCVKFHAIVQGDTPPPTTTVRVYTKSTTVLTIPAYQ